MQKQQPNEWNKFMCKRVVICGWCAVWWDRNIFIKALLCRAHKERKEEKKNRPNPAIATIFSCLFFLHFPFVLRVANASSILMMIVVVVVFGFVLCLIPFAVHSSQGRMKKKKEVNKAGKEKLDFMLCHSPQQPRFVFVFVLCCMLRDYMGLCELWALLSFMIHGGQIKMYLHKYIMKNLSNCAFDLNVSILHWITWSIQKWINQQTPFPLIYPPPS